MILEIYLNFNIGCCHKVVFTISFIDSLVYYKILVRFKSKQYFIYFYAMKYRKVLLIDDALDNQEIFTMALGPISAPELECVFLKNTPIIISKIFSDKHIIKEISQLGESDFITKPHKLNLFLVEYS